MKKGVLWVLSISMLFLLSGCVSIDIYQKLKPGGEYDMSIEFSLPEMMMQTMPDDFEQNMSESINPEYRDSTFINITDNGFSYNFKNLKFGEKKQFFIEEAENESSDSMAPGEMEFMDPSLYEYTDKGSTVRYTIHIPEDESAKQDNMSQMNSAMMGEMFSVTYTIETFGEILETNGVVDEQNPNLVVFDIDLIDGGDYYVEFQKESSGVISWIMDNLMYVFIGIGGAIVLVLLFITIHKRRGSPKNFDPSANSPPGQPTQAPQQSPPAGQQPNQGQQPAQPAPGAGQQTQQQSAQRPPQDQTNQGNQGPPPSQ